MEYHLVFQWKVWLREGGVWPAQCSEGWEVNKRDRVISGKCPGEPSLRAALRSRVSWSAGKPAVHLVGCLATPQAASWSVVTDNGTTGRRAVQRSAPFTVCGVRCYQLGNSCCQHLYSCQSLFSPSVSSSFCLSWRKMGICLSFVAELGFRMSGGMVEPLMYRKEKGDWVLRKGGDTTRKSET